MNRIRGLLPGGQQAPRLTSLLRAAYKKLLPVSKAKSKDCRGLVDQLTNHRAASSLMGFSMTRRDCVRDKNRRHRHRRQQMPQIGYMRMTSKIRHQSHPSPGFGRAKPMETTDMSMVAGSCSRYLYSLYYTLHYFFCCFQPLHYHYNYVFSSFLFCSYFR